ncbi:MAG: hypothetical protein M1831_003010 [Alyxoria varia]|nr:MAG: hypothetical protein M1831_003010 [Alyxoria varia]
MASLLNFLPLPSFNALLSLPVLSYFLLPTTTTSWTLYLNLFFFSLTWTTIVWSYPPLGIEFLSLLVIRVLFFILPSALFLAFDSLLPSLSQSIKAQGHAALPARAANASSNPQKRNLRLLRIVGISTLNIFLSTAVQIAMELFVTQVLGIRSALRITSRLPVPWLLAKDLARGLLIRAILSYYIHKHLLHSPEWSPFLTRMHVRYAHSLTTTMPFAGAYDHPLPYLVHKWLPLYLPALIFRFHILSFLLLVSIVSLEEMLVPSGYSVLPGSTVLLAGMARREEGHFMSGGPGGGGGGGASQYGNFAAYGLLDWLHGTSVSGSQTIAEDLETEGRKRKPAMKKGASKANGALKGLANQSAESESESSEGDNDDLDESDGSTRNLRSKDSGQGWTDSLKNLGGGKNDSNDGGGSWKEAITTGRGSRRSVRRN